jgi:short-subunit dehydrogenase
MKRSIPGSAIVVVGASSGVGAATAESLAAAGANLVLVARSETAIEQSAQRCRPHGTEVIAMTADISRADDLDGVVAQAVERFGRIDTWIECASVLVAGDLDAQPVEDIGRLIEVNVLGTALASRAAIAQFRRQGHGVLINVSSLLGIVPNPLVPTYVMSKFAILGLSLSLHARFGHRSGIRVCTVMPAPIDTPIFQNAANHLGRPIRAIAPAASPERVAATVIRSVRRPRRERTVGLSGALIVLGHHVVPRFTEAAVATITARLLVKQGTAPTRDAASALWEPPADSHVDGGWRRGAVRRRMGDAVGRRLARR